MNLYSQSLRRMGPSRYALAAAALGASLMAGPALAQSDAMATAPATAAQSPPAVPAAATNTQPSQIMVVNLIRLLVKQGVITQDAANALVKQAEDEAAQAQMAAASAPPAAPTLPPPAPGVVRVPYVPEVVRNQIRDEIKQDVMAQAQAEGWAAKNMVPDWVNRIHWSGDFRFRDQFSFYGANNYAPYIDFATFNSNGPIDINPLTAQNNIPILNTTTNRLDQLSVRARLAMTADIAKGVTTTIRLATGSDGSPVSTTQLLGGGLVKKDIWLDQAYITLKPVEWVSAQFGRFPNPFMHTDLVYDDNLNFDGAAAEVNRPFGPDGLKLFGSGGAFPLNYVGVSSPTNVYPKTSDRTSWLFALQGGAEYKPTPDGWSLSGAVAYYDFYHVAGVLSQPCALVEGNSTCSTDFTRPPFMQKGNTLFLLRNIIPTSATPGGTPQPQFLGLSYDYHVVDATVQFEMPLFGSNCLQLTGDYARNFAYDAPTALTNGTAIVDNYDACPAGSPATCVGPYHSGNEAFLVKATVGNPRPGAAGDWNFTIGYKYIEPDAVLDAFNDHDFHLGGTNAKGYYITASYFFANSTWVDARWFSATQVYGLPLAIDVLQLELNTRF